MKKPRGIPFPDMESSICSGEGKAAAGISAGKPAENACRTASGSGPGPAAGKPWQYDPVAANGMLASSCKRPCDPDREPDAPARERRGLAPCRHTPHDPTTLSPTRERGAPGT